MEAEAISPTKTSSFSRIRAWLPRGDTLDAKAFKERHRSLSILLALHVPALLAFGVLMGQEVLHVVAEVAPAAALLGLAQLSQTPRRLKGILVSAGLVWCSAVSVHFSGGYIEAHFHFFVILGFIALYQDWAAFGWAIFFTAMSHGAGSMLDPTAMYNHQAGQENPWGWALIHAALVLFAAVGQIIGWRHAETAQDRATALTAELIREQAARQASYARIYVNLARRNQSLLNRQLAVLDELEETEEDPEKLQKLFGLDHLTTRVRRNAESLLVMAGEESPRRWTQPVALADIVRAAASEIEQYERVDVRVADQVMVAGGAVVDVTHMLAELLENAAEYSPPSSPVLVTGRATDRGAVVIIEDQGVGLSAEDLAEANRILAEPPELDAEVVRHLGFQVVGRLAAKRGLTVELRETVGGGTTAIVAMPKTVLAETADAAHDEPDHDVSSAAAEEQPPLMAAPAQAQMPTADPPPAPAPVQAVPDPDPAAADPEPKAPAAPQPVASAADQVPVEQPVPSPTPPLPPARPTAQPAPQPTAQPAPEPFTAAGGPPPLFTAKAPPSAPTGNGQSTAGPAEAGNVHPVGNGHAAADDGAQPVADNGHGGATISSAPPAASAPASTPSGLPRRTPSASLAPGLRQRPVPAEPTGPTTPPEARQALSAFQSAARAGRESAGHQHEEDAR